jgi:hypothetical protein
MPWLFPRRIPQQAKTSPPDRRLAIVAIDDSSRRSARRNVIAFLDPSTRRISPPSNSKSGNLDSGDNLIDPSEPILPQTELDDGLDGILEDIVASVAHEQFETARELLSPPDDSVCTARIEPHPFPQIHNQLCTAELDVMRDLLVFGSDGRRVNPSDSIQKAIGEREGRSSIERDGASNCAFP